MIRKIVFVITLCALAPLSFAQKQIPMRDFFKNVEQSSFQLSPDGNWISYLSPYESRMNIWVKPRSGGEAKRLTSETARDIGGYWFKANDRIIYLKDKDGDENFHLFSVDVAGSQLKDL